VRQPVPSRESAAGSGRLQPAGPFRHRRPRCRPRLTTVKSMSPSSLNGGLAAGSPEAASASSSAVSSASLEAGRASLANEADFCALAPSWRPQPAPAGRAARHPSAKRRIPCPTRRIRRFRPPCRNVFQRFNLFPSCAARLPGPSTSQFNSARFPALTLHRRRRGDGANQFAFRWSSTSAMVNAFVGRHLRVEKNLGSRSPSSSARWGKSAARWRRNLVGS